MEETAKKYAACRDYGQVKNYEHFYLWFPFKKTSDVTYNGTNFLQKIFHVQIFFWASGHYPGQEHLTSHLLAWEMLQTIV